MVDILAEPIVTYSESGRPFAVFCGVCHRSCWTLRTWGDGPMALSSAMDAARSCCTPKPCDRCGEPIKPGMWCAHCRSQLELEQLLSAFEKAKKVPLAEYGGEMVTDGHEYFAFTTDCDDDSDGAIVLEDGTRFFWGTYPEKPSVDLERECSENWLSEFHEDALEQVDFKQLREAQRLVNEALSPVTSYYEDRSVAVLLPRPEETSES